MKIPSSKTAKSLAITLTVFLSFSAGLFSQKKGEKEELATLSILNYEDKTGTKDFGYMPGSLNEAIDKALQKRFQYVKADATRSEKTAAQIKQKAKKFGPEEAEAFCKQTNTDILVMGSFRFDKEENVIIITTRISLGSKENFRTLPEKRNPVDNTIFQAVEHVADSIILEMTKIALEQKEKAKVAGKKEEPAKKNEKMKLEKMKDTGPKWDGKNWNTGITLPGNIPVSTLGNYLGPGGGVSLFGRRQIWGNVFLGSSFFFTYNDSKNTDSVKIELFSLGLIASAGYEYRLSDRFRLISELGAGYYIARLRTSYKRPNTNEYDEALSKGMNNPAIRGGIGFHWLAFEKVFLGLEVHALTLADKGNPWPIMAQAGVTVGYTF